MESFFLDDLFVPVPVEGLEVSFDDFFVALLDLFLKLL
jgi:hypothetical protein